MLYAWRAPKVGLGGSFALLSRESLLLANNVLFTTAAGTVLLGTLAPLIVDALVAVGILGPTNKISVGAPYFNLVFVPIMALAIFFMGVGPVAKWKKAEMPELAARVRWAGISAVIVAVIMPFLLGHWSWLVSLGILMAFWIIFTVVHSTWDRLRRSRSDRGWWGRFAGLPKSFLGMQLAHFGVAVFILGVTVIGGYETGKDVKMDIGDTVKVAGYTFRFDGVMDTSGPNYKASRGIIKVFKDGLPVEELNPEKRIYEVQRQPTTEAAIDSGFFRHLFVALGEPVGNGSWSVRVYYKPLVSWIWLGCVLMALGGLLAISDRRYRTLARKQREMLLSGAEQKLPGAHPNPAMTRAEVKS
jgi:cytochrome c-type biogenesis protein CcmF